MDKELNKSIYHINDTLKHKAAIMNCLTTYISNYDNKDSIIHIIEDVVNALSGDNFLNVTDDLTKILADNTAVYILKNLSIVNNEDIKEFDIETILYLLSKNIILHDNSKIFDIEEYTMYKNVVYKLDGLEHGTPEHKAAIKELDKGFEIHANNNEHHPEHFCGSESITNKSLLNIKRMNLFLIIEMLLDWCAASICRNFKFRLSSVKNKQESLGLSDELVELFISNIKLILDKDHIDDDI